MIRLLTTLAVIVSASGLFFQSASPALSGGCTPQKSREAWSTVFGLRMGNELDCSTLSYCHFVKDGVHFKKEDCKATAAQLESKAKQFDILAEGLSNACIDQADAERVEFVKIAHENVAPRKIAELNKRCDIYGISFDAYARPKPGQKIPFPVDWSRDPKCTPAKSDANTDKYFDLSDKSMDLLEKAQALEDEHPEKACKYAYQGTEIATKAYDFLAANLRCMFDDLTDNLEDDKLTTVGPKPIAELNKQCGRFGYDFTLLQRE